METSLKYGSNNESVANRDVDASVGWRWRHSGMEPNIKGSSQTGSWMSKTVSVGENEMLEQVKGHRVTHLVVRERLPTDIVRRVAPNLTHLCVRNADKTTIENLSQLQNLEVIDLSQSKFASGEVLNVLSSLAVLRDLDLSRCELKALPNSLSQLKKLEQLNLADNQFTSAESLNALSSLSSLRALNMANCELKALPESLSQLQRLEVIELSRNKFASGEVLNVLSSLAVLRDLDLSQCELKALPNSLSQLKKLEKLNLAVNQFTSAESLNALSSLSSLRALNMANCELKALPESMCQLRRMEKLHLSHNRFPPEALNVLSSLQSLRELDLSNCELDNLPDSMQSLQHLHTLYLRANNFTRLPLFVSHLKNLEKFALGGNGRLQSIEPSIVRLGRLSTVEVDNCSSLKSPPLEVCRRGPNAIKEFYRDSGKMSGGVQKVLPVYVPPVMSHPREVRLAPGPSLLFNSQGVRNVSNVSVTSPSQKVHQSLGTSVLSTSQNQRLLNSSSGFSAGLTSTWSAQIKPSLSPAQYTTLQTASRSDQSAIYPLTSIGGLLPQPQTATSTLPYTYPPPPPFVMSYLQAAGSQPVFGSFLEELNKYQYSLPGSLLPSSQALPAFQQQPKAVPSYQQQPIAVPSFQQQPIAVPSFQQTPQAVSTFQQPQALPAYLSPPQTVALSLVLPRNSSTVKSEGSTATMLTYQTLTNVPPTMLTNVPPMLKYLPATLPQSSWPQAMAPQKTPPASPSAEQAPFSPSPRPPPVVEVPPPVPGPSRAPQPPAGEPALPRPTGRICYDGLIRGQTLKLQIGEDGSRMIFPFRETGTVESLLENVSESSNAECLLLDTDETNYASHVRLYMIRTPFICKIGDRIYNRVTESEERKRKFPPFTDSEAEEDEEEATSSKSRKRKKKAMFGIVSSVQQAVDLMSYIHKLMTEKSFTVNKALKHINKDRKTVDRFRNIYYLHVLDPKKLEELESEWKSTKRLGGLFRLDEMAKGHIDPDEVKENAEQGKLTIFGEAALRT